MGKQLFVVGLLAGSLIASAAWSGDNCTAPMSRWQPRDAVAQKAVALGWTVDRIRTDDGCYKVYAHDAAGKRIKAEFNPQSLEMLELEVDGHESIPDQGGSDGGGEVKQDGSGN